MKKFEYILYAVALIVLVLTILIKAMGWYWAGPFLIITYTIIAAIFVFLSFLIFTTENETQKRIFFLYGTIPLGVALYFLLTGVVAKLQHWPWQDKALNLSIYLFVICEIIFVVSYLVVNNPTKKYFIKQMIIRILVFIAILLAVIVFDFDKLISAISTEEVNEIREERRKEAEQYQGEPTTVMLNGCDSNSRV